jgi:hypothetical protein
MDIAGISTGMSQSSLMQEASMKVQKMSLDNADVQAQALDKLFASAQMITDPALGRNIDIFA